MGRIELVLRELSTATGTGGHPNEGTTYAVTFSTDPACGYYLTTCTVPVLLCRISEFWLPIADHRLQDKIASRSTIPCHDVIYRGKPFHIHLCWPLVMWHHLNTRYVPAVWSSNTGFSIAIEPRHSDAAGSPTATGRK
jgi:hypothetical protein